MAPGKQQLFYDLTKSIILSKDQIRQHESKEAFNIYSQSESDSNRLDISSDLSNSLKSNQKPINRRKQKQSQKKDDHHSNMVSKSQSPDPRKSNQEDLASSCNFQRSRSWESNKERFSR